MIDLSEQDEEFLECINDLSGSKKNSIIGYIKNKCDAHKEQGKKDERKILRNLFLSENFLSINNSAFEKELMKDGSREE